MKTEGIFEKISGLNMPGLILLAARPGMGKTSFALNMARIVAEKKTAAVFSMEKGGAQTFIQRQHSGPEPAADQ